MSAANIVTNYMRHKMKETAQSFLGPQQGGDLSNQVVYVIEEKVSENWQTTAGAAVIGRKGSRNSGSCSCSHIGGSVT